MLNPGQWHYYLRSKFCESHLLFPNPCFFKKPGTVCNPRIVWVARGHLHSSSIGTHPLDCTGLGRCRPFLRKIGGSECQRLVVGAIDSPVHPNGVSHPCATCIGGLDFCQLARELRAMAIAIGVCRMANHAHWLSDVLWAAPITLLCSWVVWKCLLWAYEPRSIAQVQHRFSLGAASNLG